MGVKLVRFTKDNGDPFDDPRKDKSLAGKLNYITVTHPNIAYAVSIVSQFVSLPIVKCLATWDHILYYLKWAFSLSILIPII